MSIGERLIPHVIDQLAESEPNEIWAAYPASFEAFKQGELTQITWKTLSNSINRLSWWLVDQLGHGEHLETLCYVGPSDIRYFMFAVAACKTGYKVSLEIFASISEIDSWTRHFSHRHAIKQLPMYLSSRPRIVERSSEQRILSSIAYWTIRQSGF